MDKPSSLSGEKLNCGTALAGRSEAFLNALQHLKHLPVFGARDVLELLVPVEVVIALVRVEHFVDL